MSATSTWFRWFLGRLPTASASGPVKEEETQGERDQAGRESDAHGGLQLAVRILGSNLGRIARGRGGGSWGALRQED
jgi:hypothetical protein